MAHTPMTMDDVRDALIEAVSLESAMDPEDVDTGRPFTSYGLDSLSALAVAVEIEERCGLSELPASLMWEYPTIDALAKLEI